MEQSEERYLLTEPGIKLVTDTANDLQKAKGYATTVKKSETKVVIQALYIIKAATSLEDK